MLKNYTSEVPVTQTINRIEAVLIRSGVTGIEKEYGPGGKIMAIIFRAKFDGDKICAVRLPAKENECTEALWRAYVGTDRCSPDGNTCYGSRKRRRRKDFEEQGARTAWELVQDWIEVQMSFIEMQQAELIEVFLPYIWDGRQTFFNTLKDRGFKQLTSGSSD